MLSGLASPTGCQRWGNNLTNLDANYKQKLSASSTIILETENIFLIPARYFRLKINSPTFDCVFTIIYVWCLGYWDKWVLRIGINFDLRLTM